MSSSRSWRRPITVGVLATLVLVVAVGAALLRTPLAIRSALGRLSDPDEGVRAEAARELWAIGPPVREPLRAWFASAPRSERSLALAALIGGGGPDFWVVSPADAGSEWLLEDIEENIVAVSCGATPSMSMHMLASPAPRPASVEALAARLEAIAATPRSAPAVDAAYLSSLVYQSTMLDNGRPLDGIELPRMVAALETLGAALIHLRLDAARLDAMTGVHQSGVRWVGQDVSLALERFGVPVDEQPYDVYWTRQGLIGHEYDARAVAALALGAAGPAPLATLLGSESLVIELALADATHPDPAVRRSGGYHLSAFGGRARSAVRRVLERVDPAARTRLLRAIAATDYDDRFWELIERDVTAVGWMLDGLREPSASSPESFELGEDGEPRWSDGLERLRAAGPDLLTAPVRARLALLASTGADGAPIFDGHLAGLVDLTVAIEPEVAAPILRRLRAALASLPLRVAPPEPDELWDEALDGPRPEDEPIEERVARARETLGARIDELIAGIEAGELGPGIDDGGLLGGFPDFGDGGE